MISIDDKALIGQGEAALLAVEAILMPGVSLVIHHIGAMAEPCRDRGTRDRDWSNIQAVIQNGPKTFGTDSALMMKNLRSCMKFEFQCVDQK